MIEIKPLNGAITVDFGNGQAGSIGGSQPAKGVHNFKAEAVVFCATKDGHPQIYARLAVAQTLFGDASEGRFVETFLTLPRESMKDKGEFSRGQLNRFFLAYVGQAYTGNVALDNGWLERAFVGRIAPASYLPYVRAEDNGGTELDHVIVPLLVNNAGKNELDLAVADKFPVAYAKTKVDAQTPGYSGNAPTPGTGAPTNLPAIPGVAPTGAATQGTGAGFSGGMPNLPAAANQGGGSNTTSLPPLPR